MAYSGIDPKTGEEGEIYVSDYAVMPAYRNTMASGRLMNQFLERVQDHARYRADQGKKTTLFFLALGGDSGSYRLFRLTSEKASSMGVAEQEAWQSTRLKWMKRWGLSVLEEIPVGSRTAVRMEVTPVEIRNQFQTEPISGGILWSLGGREHPERAWWVESLALIGVGGVLWGLGLPGIDMPSFLRLLGIVFVGAHVAEFLGYRIFSQDRAPPLKNTGWSLLIVSPLILISFLNLTNFAALALVFVLKPSLHWFINKRQSNTQSVSEEVSQTPSDRYAWKVKVWDPLREQIKWFFPLSILFPFGLVFLSLQVTDGLLFGAFLSMTWWFGEVFILSVIPYFLEFEHPNYTSQERNALIGPAESIARWTLWVFLLSYVALSPWWFNGIAEAGQFFDLISNPTAKSFFLSALAGNGAGLIRHLIHNERTFPALVERRTLGWTSPGTFLPLSRTSGRNAPPKPKSPNARYPLDLSKREELLLEYYDFVVTHIRSREEGPDRENKIRELVQKIKTDNGAFYEDYRTYLEDAPRLNSNPPLFYYLLNLGIFTPLNANHYGFVEPSKQGGLRWVNLDPNGWDGINYLGQPIQWSYVISDSGGEPETRMGYGGGFGVVLQPQSFQEIAAGLLKEYPPRPEGVFEQLGQNHFPGDRFIKFHKKKALSFDGKTISPIEQGQWVEALRIRDREAVVQLLKDNAYAILIELMSPDQQNAMEGRPANLRGSDATVELTVSKKSALRNPAGNIEFPKVPLILIARLSGLYAMLKYLNQWNQNEIALVVFSKEMADVCRNPQIPANEGIIKILTRSGYESEAALLAMVENRTPDQAVKEILKLIAKLVRDNFVNDNEREKTIGNLRAEARRIAVRKRSVPDQRTGVGISASGASDRSSLHGPLPEILRYTVTSRDKPTRIIADYFNQVGGVYRAIPENRPILVRQLLEDLKRDNPAFADRYGELLNDFPGLVDNLELLLTLVNFAIFIPLGTCLDSNPDPTQPPEGYFTINKNTWRVKNQFGQLTLSVEVQAGSPRAETALGVAFGVGLFNTSVSDIEATKLHDRLFTKSRAYSFTDLQNLKNNPSILFFLSHFVLSKYRSQHSPKTPMKDRVASEKYRLKKSINNEIESMAHVILGEEAFTRALNGLRKAGFDYFPVSLSLVRKSILKKGSSLENEDDETVLTLKTRLTSVLSVGRFALDQDQGPLGTAQILKFIEKEFDSQGENSATSKFIEVVFGEGATRQTIAEALLAQGDSETWLPWLVNKCETVERTHFYSSEEMAAMISDLRKSPNGEQTFPEDTPLEMGSVRGQIVDPRDLPPAISSPEESSRFSASDTDRIQRAKSGLLEGHSLDALLILMESSSGRGEINPLVRLGTEILSDALHQAQGRVDGLLSQSDPVDEYLSQLQKAIRDFRALGNLDSPLGRAINNEDSIPLWEAMIELLQKKMRETIRVSFPGILPAKLHEFSQSLGFSDDERQFLFHYQRQYTPGTPVAVSEIRWVDKSDSEKLDIQESIWEKLGDADALPLKSEVQDETPNDVILFGPQGELTVNGYEVVFPERYSPPGYNEGFNKNSEIERAIFVALKIVSRHPDHISETRSEMGGLGVHKKKPLGHTIFVKFVGKKAFVLWVGPVNKSHGPSSTAAKKVDGEVIARAKELNEGSINSIPLKLKHFRPNESKGGTGLNLFFFGTSEMLVPMMTLLPILFILAWVNAPMGAVVVAVILVVGLKYRGLGSVFYLIQKWMQEKAPAFLKRMKTAGRLEQEKKASTSPAKELAEIMALADNGNPRVAAERIVELLNETSTPLNVETVVGPQGLGALAALTESTAFRSPGFQKQFSTEMGKLFPAGFSLVRARRAVEQFALGKGTVVSSVGLARDGDMKTKNGFVAVVTREMLKDLSKRVGAFEKAAEGKPIFWVAEGPLVYVGLKNMRPSANVLIRPHLVDRAGAVVVVSGKVLDRVVRSNRYAQNYAIVLPKGAQVDMDGVDEASVLRNAAFFFLDDLLVGVKLDFTTLQKIDAVARRITSSA